MTIDNQPATLTTETAAQTLTIEGKQFGRGGKALFPNFQMVLPEVWQGGAISLRDLLTGVVEAQVAAFQTRQDARAVLQALSAQQIADGAAKGKINYGELDGAGVANVDEAVATALLAFEDGLFFVFVNDEQKTELSETFAIAAGTRVTFLRLVALAGG